MASPRSIVSILLSSVVCLVIGFIAGRSTGSAKLESTGTGKTAASEQLWSGSESSAMPTNILPDSSKQVVEDGMEDVDMADNNAVATLPISALELLSSAAVNVPGDNLFNGEDAVIDALAIDDMEKAGLQSAYRKVGDQLKSEEASATQVVRDTNGTVTLSVPSMMQERNRAREKFSVDVLSLLGEDRGKVFLAAKQHSSMFGKEGAPKDYLVEMEAVGDGNYRYRVSEMEGDTRRVFVGNSIPTRLRHLTGVAKIVPVLETFDDEEE